MALFKQKCMRCKKVWVLSSHGTRYLECYDCMKPQLDVKIANPKMKKLFNIPEDFYKDSMFLRSIKSNYLRFGKLTEKQIEAFKNTVEKMKVTKQ